MLGFSAANAVAARHAQAKRIAGTKPGPGAQQVFCFILFRQKGVARCDQLDQIAQSFAALRELIGEELNLLPINWPNPAADCVRQ